MKHMNASFDGSYIEEMSAGDQGVKKQLLQMLLDSMRRDLHEATQLLADNNWDGLVRFCHHFKSTIVFSANKKLIEANQQLWDIAKKQRPIADAQRILQSMQQLAKGMEQEIENLLKKT